MIRLTTKKTISKLGGNCKISQKVPKNSKLLSIKKAKGEKKDAGLARFTNNGEHKKELIISSAPVAQQQIIAEMCLLIFRKNETKRLQLITQLWPRSLSPN
jgi:hypothetical protein